MGIIFTAPGILIYFVCGIWGLFITFGIVQNVLGTVIAIISLILAPALLALAPWYAGIAEGDWFPLMLIYGGSIGGTVLVSIGSAISGDK